MIFHRSRVNAKAKLSDGKLRTYRKYNHLIRTMVAYGCCNTYTTFNTLTYFMIGLIICGFNIQSLNCILAAYYYKNDLSIAMKQISRCFGCIMINLKICCFLFHRKYIMEFDRTLNNFFEEELTRSEEVKSVILSNINNFYIPTWIYTIVSGFVFVTYMIPVFYKIIFQLVHLQMPTRYGLPFRNIYWWPVPDGIIYHLHFVYEMYVSWFFLFITCGVDTLFGFYTYQMSAVLRAMAFRLTNSSSKENISYLLRTAIEKHKKLLKCQQYLEHFYGPIIIWPILINAVIMCTLVYEALPITDMTIEKFMMVFSYTSVKLMQTFFYTCYGTSITSASEDFRQGIYCTLWPDAITERHLRTTMIMILMQEPMTMTAMKICPISVNTFRSILNTAVSYFFLLQTLQER